jgi:hypothetical protein
MRKVHHRAPVVHAVQVVVVLYHIRIYTVHSLDFLVIVRCFLGYKQ